MSQNQQHHWWAGNTIYRVLLTPVLNQNARVAILLVGLQRPYLVPFEDIWLFWGIVALLVAALGGYWLAGKVLRPVNMITQMAREINATDLRRPLHLQRRDEFVEKEVEALRKADPTRPIMMNGFLPTSLPVSLSQWWRTRDQGDSLAVAQRMADIVGIDYYPRHALMPIGTKTLYLDGSKSPWQYWRRKQVFAWTRTHEQRLMVAEGQAEPWETETTPPNPSGQAMYSCLPEHLITNYNTCMRWSRRGSPLYAYLFWGAEYWMLREQYADSSYIQAFARILESS